uniref:Uncharacterized protein n=1 Tax=Chromera velia CCMP2878 TaxID=1169474 RepID=A0A0G4HN18_9ALVE|eukprot:Cvel_7581.t1-p1 / transcript=Cvel_7581.t1 / gene=Cvel_7581 / organism=Chromera_velia_CCMP2878 / gene_product=hypothetical protein / transcript_product=hypothetical protein / location=Cvel_scaffold399:46231-47403(-) / protein_length=391 / sequence_SO=supercontig / SO=protein_coding / is_pseudo=false
MLLRESLRPSGDFGGLEEPSIPLPHFAKADIAVRPIGCSEDLWLPVQVKSRTSHSKNRPGRRRQTWEFQDVSGYSGMSVICISLQKGLQEPPLVWIFPGGYFEYLAPPGKLSICRGGKHDTEERRCSFEQKQSCSRHVGRRLLSLWERAKRGESSQVKLESFATLQTQLGRAHLAEWKMLQKCLELFGSIPEEVETREARCASLPYDLEIRLVDCPQRQWQRLQLKSAFSVNWSDDGPGSSLVTTRKRTGQLTVPYYEDDFDFLLVSSPQNDSAYQEVGSRQMATSPSIEDDTKNRWRFFYLIPMAELVKEGVVSTRQGGQVGVKTFTLDFSRSPLRAKPRNRRSSRLIKWRVDASDSTAAGIESSSLLFSRQSRGFAATTNSDSDSAVHL